MKTKHIFLIGPGNVGRQFIAYLKTYNRKNKKQKLALTGVLNSKNMILGEKNIYAKVKNLSKQPKADIVKFIDHAKSSPGKEKIIIDCTASRGISEWYPNFARCGFHIVAANKFFNTKPLSQYRKLRKILAQKNKKFLYTTNVGSGLPIIPTIKSFMQSSDEIQKIEGVFSGSLSYLFNWLEKGRRFSSVIKKAIKLGYMEPDPREDLTGRDAARKLLILARELGIPAETKDIKIQNLVPAALRKLKNPKQVVARLKEYNAYFDKTLKKAKSKNCALKYVARLTKNKAAAKLEMLPYSNPIAHTADMDNIFVFYTARYDKRPFIIWGAGAGAKVTAAGVLRDVFAV